MNLWIVDDDFYFSAKLKEAILASSILSPDQKKIEIFHRPGDFFERLKKTTKEPLKRPHLVFLDIQMPGQDGLEVYCELLGLNDPVIPALYFCSSMSYGVVCDFFSEKQMETPPFVRKSEVFAKLDSILARFAPEEELAGRVPVSLPVRKNRLKLNDLLEEIRKHYYGGQVGENLASLLDSLAETALALGLKDLSELTQELIAKSTDKKPLTPMRLRRELKDLLTLGDKVLKLYAK